MCPQCVKTGTGVESMRIQGWWMRGRRTMLRKMLGVTAALVCTGVSAGALLAATPGQLGKIDFPTSCSKEAQPELEKGLALLHSFQYKESGADFTEAVKRDAKCAIGYWGEAMAHYYQLW